MKFRIRRLIFVIIILLIIIGIIFIICKQNIKKQSKKNQQEVSEIQYNKEIKLGIAKFDTINPLITNNKEMIYLNKLIYEPLFTLDQQYKLTPCLATEFAKLDKKTYLVKINTNIKWSNGEKLVASDIEYTIQNLKLSKSIYKENVQNISKVEVIDDSTIKIQLDHEEMFFEYNLIFPIINKKYYDTEDYFVSTKIPIGTGMLKISSINSDSLILQKNENWRDVQNKNLNFEKVSITFYGSIGEAYNSFKIGNIDFINTNNINYQDNIGKLGYYIKEYKGRNIDFISANCNDVLISDKFIRKAINYAIDKNNIVSSVYNNKYYISEYPLDSDMFLYKNSGENYEYNPEKAKKILQENGWNNNNNKWIKNGKTLELSLIVDVTNVERCKVAECIEQQLEEIGIKVDIKKVSNSQYFNYLQNKNYQMIITGISNSFSPDITYFYGEGNISNYSNEEVKNILNEIKNITDEKLLIEKYKKIIEITKDEVPYICLYRNKNTILIKQNAGGQVTPNNYNIFYNFETWHTE